MHCHKDGLPSSVSAPLLPLDLSLWRYLSWTSPLAKKVEEGKATLEEIEAYALKTPEPVTASGKQEYLEQLINRYI